MLTKFEIGNIRSFANQQNLSLAVPDGTKGSGYNVILGKNNSGKSTIIKLMRELISNQDTLTISQEARHESCRPWLAIEYSVNGKSEHTTLDTSGTGGLFPKVGGNYRNAASNLWYIPSRRPFASEFNSSNNLNPDQYEHQDYLNRRNNAAYFDSVLAASLARLLIDRNTKDNVLNLLTGIDERITGLDADNIGGRDVIRFRSASGRWHIISDTGDGIINLIRIIHAIIGSIAGHCIIIDEPELSLHPQLQRMLYELLYGITDTRQVIVVTHSPHFVNWRDIASQGLLIRLYLDNDGTSKIRVASRERLSEVRKSAHANITSRKYFDSVCKELFFSDRAVLVEGPDDVHYISNYLETRNAPGFPLMGYGCGGADNVIAWARLCNELGIRTAALYDGDKRAEFLACIQEFSSERSPIGAFLLSRDDIRDKHLRDEFGRETGKVAKTGIFKRNGTIHQEVRGAFDLLLRSIETYLHSN